MIENVQKGQVVYFFRVLDSYIIKGTVTDETIREDVVGEGTDNPITYKYIWRVHWDATIDANGKEAREIGGCSSVLLDRCFSTASEANNVQEKEREKYKNQLRKEITDLKSLLEFPLHNALCGDPDWLAIEVYKEAMDRFLKGAKNEG